MNNFRISISHFYCLEYVEDEKKIFLDIDFRESKILIGESLIKKWESPYESIEITENDRKRIYSNIKEFLFARYSQENILEIY